MSAITGLQDRLSAGLSVAAAVMLLASCGGGAPESADSTRIGAEPSSASPCGVVDSPPGYANVVWILMENRGPDQVVGSPDAPYFNAIADKCGLATNAHAITHPSLPNYIAMTSGDTQGITDDAVPAQHPLTAESIFSQLGPGRWRSLSQSMPGNCYREETGTYVPRHNPPTYYTNIADQCEQQAIPLADAPDLTAPFTFIAPDQRSNSHDTDVAHSDAWLAGFLPKVLDSAQYRAGRTAVVLTYDEDEDAGNAENPIPMLVISPSTAAGTRVDVRYTLYSLLRTTEELLGLKPLGQAGDAESMRAGFNL